jgi:tetratricopeptide (TPR) repeat protein
VAYETLSKRDRKARHLAVAAHLLQSFGDEEEVVEVVASHYLDAYRSAPDAEDAAGIRDTARGMLTRAGERAASLAANEEAQRYFEQGLELADDPSIQALLHERAGGVAWAAARSEAATGHLEAAIGLFKELGQTHPAARVSAALAEVIWNQNRGEEAIARMRQALDVLADEEPDADVATLAAQLARFEWLGGQSDEAARHIEFALTLAERFRLNEVLSMGFNTKGLVLRTLMRPEEAVTLVERALQIALDNNLSAPALRAYNNLVAMLNSQERHEEEFELCQKALALARKVGNRPWELQLSATAAAALVDLGRWDEAVARAEEVQSGLDVGVGILAMSELWPVVMVHIERGDKAKAAALAQDLEENLLADEVQSHSAIKVVQSRMLHADGRYAEGLVVANEALSLSMKSGLEAFVARAFALASECAWSLGDEAELERLLGVADGMAPGGVTPFLAAQAMRFHALVATKKGDGGGAENGFKGAAGIFRELSMPFWLAVVLNEHGEQLVGLDRREKAEPMLTEAREIFERLLAQPWLERLDRLQVGAGAVV